jgi:hypothetical protein
VYLHASHEFGQLFAGLKLSVTSGARANLSMLLYVRAQLAPKHTAADGIDPTARLCELAEGTSLVRAIAGSTPSLDGVGCAG